MNLKYLKQFLELSQYNSMYQYALANNVTHGQVSRMVAELEKEFKYQLIIRDKSHSKVQLTDKGEILVKRIPYIFNEIENTRSLIKYDEQFEGGIFDLITTTYLVDYWISPHLIKLKKEYPNLTLNLFCNEEILSEEEILSREEKRFQFTISPKTVNDDGIIQVKLKDFHIGLWASKSYIKRYGMPEHVEDLSRHTILCFERNWTDRAYPTMNWYMKNTHIKLQPENIIVIKSSVGIMKAAQEGLGIFSLSQENIQTMGMNFERILPDLEGPVVSMCFSYHQTWKNYKSVKIIEAFLKEIFKKRLPTD